MQKMAFSGIKSLDRLRSLNESLSGTGKTTPISNLRNFSSDSVSYGSFANLKLTAEKLVKEQASVKTDLEMAHMKLKRATEQIQILEVKFQEAVNENAKLIVKQTEDAKLWKGLDSKLSSTKTLCDQLTETLQQLAGQTRTAEEDKKHFEEKLLDNSKAFEHFNLHLDDLSAKLEHAGNTIRIGDQKMLELQHEKEEMEKSFMDEHCAIDNVVKEKDALIKQFEDAVEENKKHLQALDSQLHEMQHELTSKEEVCKCLKATQEILEKEKNILQCSNRNLEMKADKSCQQIKELQEFVHALMAKLVEMDKESLSVSSHVAELFASFGTYCELVQQQKDLATKCAQEKIDNLHKEILGITSENVAYRAEIEELKNKIMELQKAQEFIMVQHAEECRLAEDNARRLESEAEALVSKKNESVKLAIELEEKLKILSEASSLKENQMQELSQKISSLESENHSLQEKVQLVLHEITEEKEALHNEITEHNHHSESLENQIRQLHDALNEKEQLNTSSLDREKQLEQQKIEIQALLTAAECKLTEERKQFDLMLEGKQLELSKHLKELSQRNDQAINEIRRKYEAEKVEIVNMEKEKADKLIKEMERKRDEKILENKEEAQQYLMRAKEEHGAMIMRIQQDHEQKELTIQAHQKEELQRIQLQAEKELRERSSSLRKEQEIQIKALNMQHEDDCRKLQDELELQKSKEEKQRALLQLQWKVMSGNQQDDQEVNSKKEYSVSSRKMRESYGGKENQLALTSPESRKKDVRLSGLIRTPMANLLKKVETGNRESEVNIPKHRKKVTRHEYEVETSNGTITKRRRTKSTVMFGEPNTQKTVQKKTPNASKDVMKMTKVNEGLRPRSANIGDLFSEGSLNPYTDDPYAFD